MSLRQGVSGVDVQSGQGRSSEEVTSFKGLTAGEEAAAALWAPDHQPEDCCMVALRRTLTLIWKKYCVMTQRYIMSEWPEYF